MTEDRVIDGRELLPPEPMELTLTALDTAAGRRGAAAAAVLRAACRSTASSAATATRTDVAGADGTVEIRIEEA